MPVCDTCGNNYDKAFTVTLSDGSEHTFDSIECMAHQVAPMCGTCDVRVLGHGLEAEDGTVFCCDHCAERAGVSGLRDRVRHHADGV